MLQLELIKEVRVGGKKYTVAAEHALMQLQNEREARQTQLQHKQREAETKHEEQRQKHFELERTPLELGAVPHTLSHYVARTTHMNLDQPGAREVREEGGGLGR